MSPWPFVPCLDNDRGLLKAYGILKFKGNDRRPACGGCQCIFGQQATIAGSIVGLAGAPLEIQKRIVY